MHHALPKTGRPDIYSAVFSLRRAVFTAAVKKEICLESSAALAHAADRLVKLVLEPKGDYSLIRMYQLNLALRALVYDLFDLEAISDGDVDWILDLSFKLERNHLARAGYSCPGGVMDDSAL